MWKKEDAGPEGRKPTKGETDAREDVPAPARRGPTAEPATIGPSIVIRGEVTGDEDLLIEGRIDGTVDLQDQSVTVGPDGRVKADIKGRVVTVEGEVEGDLRAKEQAILRGSARVQGDITAPRVTLEDGARFRGLIDMGEPPEKEGGSKRGAGTVASAKGSGPSRSGESQEATNGGATGTAGSDADDDDGSGKSGSKVAEKAGS